VACPEQVENRGVRGLGRVGNPTLVASYPKPRIRLLNHTCEKRWNVAGESRWFFCGCEMPTALHWYPPLDVM